MTDNKYGIGEAGSMLIGAGLVKLDANLTLGLILVAAGTILKIVVAVLQKQGVDVQGGGQG